MMAPEEGSYWERACQFFRSTGFAESEGSYFIHNKNTETVKIGIRRQILVSVGDGNVSRTVDGQTTIIDTSRSDQPVFKIAESLLRKDAPCFFVVSPDMHRRSADNSIPQIHLVQPVLEFTFSPGKSCGEVTYAQDSRGQQQGEAMLIAFPEQPAPVHPHHAFDLRPFSELAAGWVPDEDDESFLHRLKDAVSILQEHPDGKMALTRAYERESATTRSPFELYELHARRNGEYACSHFSCIRENVFSLGTTPENVAEISDRTLSVDVVAGTCRPSDSDAYLARELLENPKQIREHRSSLTNRQNRFAPFCEDGSVHVVREMRMKRLRNVCHLHSAFSGELLPQVTLFDLMGSIFPLLGARPRELLAVADPELTPHRYYGGVVGHLHLGSGGCFLNIRNALLKDGSIHAKVGVGVIAESDAYSELIETRDKLSGLLEAIQLWEEPVPSEI
ncbi:chorismate-binding protein [Streptomyces anulatus]